MTDLVTGLNSLFSMFWTQLTSLSSWLTSSTLGIVLMFSIIIGFLGWLISIIFSIFKRKEN